MTDAKGGLKRKREDDPPALTKTIAGAAKSSAVKMPVGTKPLVGKTAPVIPSSAAAKVAPKPTIPRVVSKPAIAPPPTKRYSFITRSSNSRPPDPYVSTSFRLKTDAPAPAPKKTASAAPAEAKRPTWDTKGRLQDMEGLTQRLQAQMQALSNQLAAKETELKTVSVAKETLQVDLTQFTAETEAMQQRTRELLRTVDEEGAKHRLEVDQMTSKLMALQGKLDAVETQLSTSRSECDTLRNGISQSSDQLETVSKDLATTREKLRVNRDLSEERLKKIQELERIAAEQQKTVDYLEVKSKDDEDTRRKLSNTIQDLKGNIRVYCRVRPGKPEEYDEATQFSYARTDDTLLDISSSQNSQLSGCKGAPEKKYTFKFDKVLSPETSQESLFSEITQILHASLDGANSCIFSYGPTGSGKTHTMEGGSADDEGLIPRSVNYIFQHSYRMAEKGWDVKFEASYVEIYFDTLRDLLFMPQPGMPVQDEKRLEIKHESDSGRVYIHNLTATQLVAPQEISGLLQRAQENRATVPNWVERSSRSHSIFQIKVISTNRKTDKTTQSFLNFIDLCGSEKVLVPPAQAPTTNRGLLSLNDVISALANKEKNIPYKSSKLTYLLQDSLSTNGKTLFIMSVAPGGVNLPETLNTLRMAQKINACEIGSARK